MFVFPEELVFVDDLYNAILNLLICLLIPVSLLSNAVITKKTLLKTSFYFLFLVVLFPCLFIGFFTYLDIGDIVKNGTDPSVEKIESLKVGDYDYVLYRLNGGATTSFSLLLTKERELPMGLKYVDRIFLKEKSYKGKIEKIDDHLLALRIEPNYATDKETVFRVKIADQEE
ncbi:hypothetical protein [Desulfuromonas acetoxidans]|uniref:hypothetical protein n=1 Tax=Desulfuromonas acetoxidans TaxID=891 RepID=UPI00292EA0CA|nr:hypothetical protein [Desulfuromonas acetoxidans]